MSNLQARAFETSELVQKWLSNLGRDSMGPRSLGLNHEGTGEGKEMQKGTYTVIWVPRDARRTHHHKDGRDPEQGYRHGQGGGAAHPDFGPSSGEKTLSHGAVVEKLNDMSGSHKDTVEDPSAKYARRPRHKTKEDTYEYKDGSEKRAKKRLSKDLVKQKPGATLTKDFQAPNVAVERLTLRRTGPGFLHKGKSSGNAEWKGLPDLTFSEMTFLKRKRKDEIAKTGESQLKKKHCRPSSQEISAFFHRPEDQQHRATPLPKPSSIGSYFSWSVSSPQTRLLPMGQRSSLFAQPLEQGGWHGAVGDKLGGVGASVGSNSTLTHRFLENMTTDALLCGVDTFAHQEKEYYTLDDLKMLAEAPTAGSPHSQKALYGLDIMRNVKGTATSPRSAQDQEANSVRRARELSAHTDKRHVRPDTESSEPGPLLAEDPTVVGPSSQRSAVLGAIAPLPSDMDEFDRDLWRHWIGSSARSETRFMVDDDTSSFRFRFQRPPPRPLSNYWSQPIPGIDEDQQVAYDSIGTGYLHEAVTHSNTHQHHPRSLRVPRHVVDDPVVGFSGFSRRQILY
ncbi:hypothetical protein G647_02642 [Cladophialophora carrionii CBS 160.54]|uniref:Uncharacterized protein n=1 Tax=Cladophialophora carrionii CBS 160.54 TaxID=1279043 RepID=V9DGA1_9EURO|nr:uncharacterized protein G647_02642 [Cladophialophora carrionii CBS 160.54]ETI25865.1 hypothetical protein G647_02642 [Cladophialophora carrionii CBS 160.54]